MKGRPRLKESRINKTFTITMSAFIKLDEMAKQRGMNISKALDYVLKEYFKQEQIEIEKPQEREPRSNYEITCVCGAVFSNVHKVCPSCGFDRFKAEQDKAMAELAEYNKARGLQ